MIKLVTLFFTALCASKFIDKGDVLNKPDLLNGVKLTIEDDDRKLWNQLQWAIISNREDPNYSGRMSRTGLQITMGPITVGECLREGDSKSAFDLKNKYALLLPNDGVGQVMWERIVKEEVAIDKFYSKYIKTSGVKRATFDYEGTTNYALFHKNFEGFQNEGAFIIESKNISIPKNFSDKIPERNESAWVQMLMPVAKQYWHMVSEGVTLPNGKMVSFLFAEKGSPHSLQDGPSVSIFGSDFTSKLEKRTPAWFSGPFKLYNPGQDLKSLLKEIMEGLLCVKNSDPMYYYRQTEKDKMFIKNVSEKCDEEIRDQVGNGNPFTFFNKLISK